MYARREKPPTRTHRCHDGDGAFLLVTRRQSKGVSGCRWHFARRISEHCPFQQTRMNALSQVTPGIAKVAQTSKRRQTPSTKFALYYDPTGRSFVFEENETA
jgi:hypothetical protein